MKGFWKSRLSDLKQVGLKWPQLKPPSLNKLDAAEAEIVRVKRLTFASGLFLTGIVLTQMGHSPLAISRQSSGPDRLQPELWQLTGAVRQSVVDLYRARRLLIQSGVVASSGTLSPTSAAQADSKTESAASGTNKPSTSKTPASDNQGQSQAASSASASSNRVAQPSAPPAPSVDSVLFDPGKTIDTNLEMRVAIAKDSSSIEVATSVDGYLMDLDGQNYCNLPAQSSYTLRPQGGGMGYGGCQLSNAAWLEPGEGGYVYVDGSWYKGRVLLLSEGNALLAVNFVLLYDYLSSVVGSEMYVNWPLESLKAQAVAARSYALTHHVRYANRAYDLDNTQRYQAYLGIAKETNTTQAAVAATAGEFISYDGGIVESLYAASDEIVKAAHGGNGMSQTGAMQLASQGYSYTEILGNYYPGTSLSRLVVN